jgi:hypothetical protein
MNGVLAWLDTRPRGNRKAALLGAAIADVALVVATGAAGIDPVAPFIGGVAGVVLFGLLYCAYRTVLTEEQQSRVNLRDRIALPRRRGMVFVLGALWMIILLLSSRIVPDILDTLVGTLSVFVVCGLVMLFRLSPVEEIDAALKAETDGVPLRRRRRQR